MSHCLQGFQTVTQPWKLMFFIACETKHTSAGDMTGVRSDLDKIVVQFDMRALPHIPSDFT